ncbi:hypothetical protein ACNKHP_13570 [Shigella boydii]
MTDADFWKPIIAVVNLLPNLYRVTSICAISVTGRRRNSSGCGVAKEFNTIAVDDGIAMGDGGRFIHCHLANLSPFRLVHG